jgi:hypothetical protein
MSTPILKQCGAENPTFSTQNSKIQPADKSADASARCSIDRLTLLSGLVVAACRQKRRGRFASAAALINELVEAKHQLAGRTRAGALGAQRSDCTR